MSVLARDMSVGIALERPVLVGETALAANQEAAEGVQAR
jgi:hypothetical protein